MGLVPRQSGNTLVEEELLNRVFQWVAEAPSLRGTGGLTLVSGVAYENDSWRTIYCM